MRRSGRQPFPDLILTEMKAIPIIFWHRLLRGLFGAHRVQSLARTETPVCLAARDELFRILLVGVEALGLDIWPILPHLNHARIGRRYRIMRVPVMSRFLQEGSFVIVEPKCLKRTDE